MPGWTQRNNGEFGDDVMGGKALKNTETHRVTTPEMEDTLRDVMNDIYAVDPEAMVTPVQSYRNKEDHGDIDIVVSPSFEPFINTFLDSKEDYNEVFRNGPYTSLDYAVPGTDKRVQVDLIRQPAEIHHFAANYYHYNDLGNLIGRVADAVDFKFGHKGLEYKLRFGTNHVRSILVTKDWGQAIYFLGFDPERWEEGFDNLEDIFQFVADSKFFNPDMFDLELRSHRARTRDRKRPTYTKFLDWVADNAMEKKASVDEDHMLDAACAWWPNFGAELEDSLEYIKKANAVSEKFNGHIVSDLTGLFDKELGDFMKYLRNDKEDSKREQVEFFYPMSSQEIEDYILESYEHYLVFKGTQ